jgi:ZIP family zinc transporter
MHPDYTTAIVLTLVAGLSTTIGSAVALVLRAPGKRLMAGTFGFAAGVMVLVSFAELLPRAMEGLGSDLWGYVAFFLGFLAMWGVDSAIPHEFGAEHVGEAHSPEDARLKRTGLFVALGIGIHNFPEGMATMGAALHDVKLGVAVAAAIAVHNIPEGLAVSVPIYAATGSRKKAFFWSFLSGVAEPVGALLALLVLLPFLTPAVLAATLGVVAGLMVYIALDELVPASREYGHDHWAIIGAGAGMAAMALSFLLLG